ncbi:MULTISPECIES: NAD(+)/NADH kinase [Leptotrichia]|jgi:inorganic polyphosphate/ATP-NAD kinase|uniref:NAD kinase n=1 Tax=Leptotrichia wadei TaxID=157687 RepID=A0A510KRA9_9FUSO|nr:MULTISPECIES: NAD(+)/NADH kinase [Leptotrichia]MBS6019248.1 NAD(+)/NADH kinase [Leptotrichia wadei]NWO26710.1 NAD(+)/NADH kinase [Leptotrichia sp. oral taxon 417]BBM54280.1 ATP-NAD/AcoX kinase [Leptotrichia wadei]VTX55903.1 NAD kinase [uncultured Leptotrichia sp.]
MEKLENGNVNKKNKVEKVRIIKSGYGNEELLKSFYNYLKEKNIQEVFGVEQADLIISLGGDGTMLISAKEAIRGNIPVLAINMGSLGYLAEIKPQDAVKILQDYENGNYKLEERSFLEVRYEDNIFYGLNELVITKGGHEAHLIQVEVYSNDIFVNKYRADGIIVATPTGSTAYSLSAGGSIVHPGLNALTITPLAPQSLTARPIIVNGCEVLSFKATSRDDAVHLNIDGNQWFQIQKGDLVSARISDKKVKIIKPMNSDYYSILRQKLKWGDSVL